MIRQFLAILWALSPVTSFAYPVQVVFECRIQQMQETQAIRLLWQHKDAVSTYRLLHWNPETTEDPGVKGGVQVVPQISDHISGAVQFGELHLLNQQGFLGAEKPCLATRYHDALLRDAYYSLFKSVSFVRTSEDSSQVWNVSSVQPLSNWSSTGFDERHWEKKRLPLGADMQLAHLETSSQNTSVWLRKRFRIGALSQLERNSLVLRAAFSGSIEIYLNGTLAFSGSRHHSGYTWIKVNSLAKRGALSKSDNVIAVHASQQAPGHLLDVGLYALTEPKQ